MSLSRLLTFVLLAIISFYPLGRTSAGAIHPPGDPQPPEVENVSEAAAPSFALAEAPLTCAYSPDYANMIDTVTEETWASWIRKLSGEEPVSVGGNTVTITTRASAAMFDGTSPAYEYVRETILSWYGDEDLIEDDEFSYVYSNVYYSGKNLILEIPGVRHPEQVVILTAHLDSRPFTGAAPGADDNATGAAALLEAARLARDHNFDRTIRLIWFTAEEQGLHGSKAYAADHDLSGVVGVINLDMYSYDFNNDRCIELHIGSLAQSDRIGRCLTQAIDEYNLNLSYDYLTGISATTRSDHASFWPYGIGAVLLTENFFTNGQPNGCTGGEANPYYHLTGDTIDKLNLATGLSVTKAALAAFFSIAGPYLPYKWYMPWSGR